VYLGVVNTRNWRVSKFEIERALVGRLLEAVALSGATMSNPWTTHGRETGADVEVHLGNKKVGVQVTEYHGDEGTGGSRLRQREEADAARGIMRAYAVPLVRYFPQPNA
jgi:hypothetical protein